MRIEPRWVVGRSVDVTDRDDGRTPLVEQTGRVRTTTPEPLDGNGRLLERIVVVVTGFASNECDAPSRRSSRPNCPDDWFLSYNIRIVSASCLLQVSMIHDIVLESVPISGAGMSLFGPIVSRISSANRLVRRFFGRDHYLVDGCRVFEAFSTVRIDIEARCSVLEVSSSRCNCWHDFRPSSG